MRRLRLVAALAVLVVLISAEAFAFDFTAHGYYRNRVEFTYELDTQKPGGTATQNNNRFGVIAFNQMRLRIEPMLKLNDFLSIHTQFDILDNVLYGTNETRQLDILSPVVGTVTLPAGAGSLTMVGGAAGENGSINVRRAWAEVLTPIGKLKFGRQPSNWGLGIFQNDGNGPQADFGDTQDRIMFITQKQFNDGGAINVGAVWDIAFEAQADPRIQGLGGVIRDNGQDCHQWAGIIYYERPNAGIGMFGGVRRRDGGNGTSTTAIAFNNTTGLLNNTASAAGFDGDTLLYFIDAYGKYSIREYNLQFELVYLGGKISTGVAINAIPLAAAMPVILNASGQQIPGVVQMPRNQPIMVFMSAFEADARYKWGGEWKLKAGFAEGDATPLSNRITQYGFRPDYQIALLMFHVPLGTSAPIIPNAGNYAGTAVAGRLPVTGNFINNAIYAAATYKHHFNFSEKCKMCNDFSAGLRVVTAFAHKNPFSIDFASLLGSATFPAVESRGKWYGVEFDVLVEGRFFDFLTATLEGGVLIPGSAYDINVNVIDPSNIIAPVLTDRATMAYAGRLTLMLNF